MAAKTQSPMPADLLAACESIVSGIAEWHPSWSDDCVIELFLTQPGASHRYFSGKITLGEIRQLRAVVSEMQAIERRTK